MLMQAVQGLSYNLNKMAWNARMAPSILAHKLLEPSGGSGAIDVEQVINDADGAIQDGGAFSDISGKVDSVGGGAYHIAFRISVFIFLVGLIVAGIMVFFSNSATRSEQKSNLIWKCVGIVVAFGAVSILVFFATASSNIFGE